MSPRRHVARPFAFFVGLLAAVLVLPTVAFAASPSANVVASPSSIGLAARGSAQQATLQRYARDTWASLAAMTDPQSGLPADSLQRRRHARASRRRPRTSAPTCGARSSPIGSGSSAARRRGDAAQADAGHRSRRWSATARRPVLQLVRPHDRRASSRPGRRPATATRRPILSSVDNGWLATGLQVVANARPGARARAPGRCSTAWTSASTTGRTSTGSPSTSAGHTGRRRAATTRSSARAGSRATSGSPRASSRAGVLRHVARRSPTPATGAGRRRSRSASRGPTSASASSRAPTRTTAMRIVPGWGGSMFEALMPALFVPEERSGPRSWAINHPLTVAAQIHHGLVEAGYGYWGFSPIEHARGRLRRLRRRRDRHEPRRLPLERGQHVRRPRLVGARARPRCPTRRRRPTRTAS